LIDFYSLPFIFLLAIMLMLVVGPVYDNFSTVSVTARTWFVSVRLYVSTFLSIFCLVGE